MKRFASIFLFTLLTGVSYSQFVAKADIKENIEGICSEKDIYALLPMFSSQKEAICSVKDQDMQDSLNKKVEFIKKKNGYTDKGMVSIIINCKGQVVKCTIDNKSKSPELDEQVLNVFKTFTTWTAGTLNGKPVDSIRLWSFEVNNGKITLNDRPGSLD